MNGADRRDASPDAFPDFGMAIAALRETGADRIDPVGLYYIEALAKRAAAHQGKARQMLDTRLDQALAEFNVRFEQARCEARDVIAATAPRHPHAADTLQRLFAANDFKEVQRLVAALETSERDASLSALVRQIEQHSLESGGAAAGIGGARPELKTVRNFRNTWAKLSVDKQMARALEQAPRNAGPINSHMLALRSLALMRDISPDYLNRFMSYADSLLCLDRCERERQGHAKKSQAAKSARK